MQPFSFLQHITLNFKVSTKKYSIHFIMYSVSSKQTSSFSSIRINTAADIQRKLQKVKLYLI